MRRVPDSFFAGLVGRDKAFAVNCSACMKKLRDGEAFVHTFNHTMHRICLKEWLELTYVFVPTAADERQAIGDGGLLAGVEVDKTQREFAAYRSQLLARYRTDLITKEGP